MYNITYFGNFARYIRKKAKKIKQTTQTSDLVKKKKTRRDFGVLPRWIGVGE